MHLLNEHLWRIHMHANAFSSSLVINAPGDADRRVDEVIDLLHLHGCADTIIGNDLLRGISGGEKKRITIGEGLITNARFLALDEISTG